MESYPEAWPASLCTPPPVPHPPSLHFVPFSRRQRSGPGPAGPDQSGPRGRCGCCPCCGLSSGPRSSAPRCEGAPASATLSTGTPVTPGSRAEPGRLRPGPARSRAGRAPHSRSVRGAAWPGPRAGAPLFEPAGEGEGRGEARPGLPPARTCWGAGGGPPALKAEGGISEPGAPRPALRAPPPRFSLLSCCSPAPPSWGGRSGEGGRGLHA